MPLSRPARISLVLMLLPALVIPVYAERTQLKPGWNLFSPNDDVEMGRQVAKEAERELPIMRNRQLESYINALGKRLVSQAPGERYPYQFRGVNDRSINAFALPGGFIYIHRGTIEAAANEAQLASVVAHEIAHVALRHGTNQASKAYAAQVPLQILGGALGSDSVGAVIAQLGIGFAANSVLLKYSRDAERQADLLGTQILYDSGFDPNAMVEFLEKLQAEGKGRSAEFLSSHPNPENRIVRVKEEIEKLGAVPSRARRNSSEFDRVKSMLAGLPTTETRTSSNGRTASNGDRPGRPSSRFVDLRMDYLRLRHPDNWKAFGESDAVTLAPNGGIVSGSLAYGLMVAVFEPDEIRNRSITLEDATDQLVDQLSRSNPKMRLVRRHERIRVGGEAGLSAGFVNESPLGSRERDWIVTVLRPNGLLYYFVGVAPEPESGTYQRTFEQILQSVRFLR